MYVDKNGKCDGTRLIAGDTACSEPEMCQPQQRDKPAGIEELPVVLFTKLERDSEREQREMVRPKGSIDILKEVLTGAGIRGTSVDLKL